MFTGIIEETGVIRAVSGSKITVRCKKVLENTQLGDSIAVNGCCQTVTMLTQNSFSADISAETFAVTNFSTLKSGDIVNLERALTPSSRMGGHIVLGHVDIIAKYLGDMIFELPDARYIVHKGSIAVNGVSLTVASLEGTVFSVAVIPRTFENTNLKHLRPGDTVNIETDILGRYVEKFLSTGNNISKIDENFLTENGFI